jgi:hypothetical protein
LSNVEYYIPSTFLFIKAKKPDIIIAESKIIESKKNTQKLRQISPDLYYLPEKDEVISKINILGLKAFFSIQNLSQTPTKVYISPEYRLLSKTLLTMPISTVFPDQAFIQMIIHIKLLKKGYTFLIGSCLELADSDSAILISSMGGMGKTLTLLKLLEEGGKYISDDMVIINSKGQVYSYPKPIRIRQIKGTISLESYKTPTQILGPKIKMKDTSNIGIICFLERGTKNEIETLEKSEAKRKILIITRKLLPYYMERTILAYSYMNSSFDVYELMFTESKIIEKFVENCKCCIVRSQSGNPKSYVNLIRGVINDRR